jgi:mRNA interferase RelE/StbE
VTTPYHVLISPMAIRQLKELATKYQRVILKLAEALAVNPRPPGFKKIDGMTGLYTEAVDQHRVVYKIEDQEILILLIK